MKRIVVTGIGAISCIGNDVQQCRNNLVSGVGGISKASFFTSKYTETHCFGEVKLSNEELFEILRIEDRKGISRCELLAHKAFLEAISDANLNKEELNSHHTAIISGSTVGGMCLTDQLYSDANTTKPASEYIRTYSSSAHTYYLAKQFGVKGITDTLNTACSSSANAIIVGARLIRSGRAKRVIVGGVDSLAKYTVNGFNALGILSPQPTKPFDRERIGLTLGEAAAFLVLEAAEDAAHKKVYAEVKGYGNASDAYHTSSISDEADGVVIAIEKALQNASLKSEDINYINAHGTGTGNNDQAEVTGFSKVFGSVPPFNSTKSYTGHTLGAAGALEAVFTILSIINSEIYPSLCFETPIETPSLSPVTKYQSKVNINYAMSNSYGFSGSCTSIILSKV